VVAGVVPNAVREMRRLTDGGLVAAIGPCIGQSSFEVGPEVVERFGSLFGSECPIDVNGNGKGTSIFAWRSRSNWSGRRQCGSDDTTDRCTYRTRMSSFLTGVITDYGRHACLIAPRQRHDAP